MMMMRRSHHGTSMLLGSTLLRGRSIPKKPRLPISRRSSSITKKSRPNARHMFSRYVLSLYLSLHHHSNTTTKQQCSNEKTNNNKKPQFVLTVRSLYSHTIFTISQTNTISVQTIWTDLMNDKGRIVMNLGAIASLTGFMMSDVLHLRMLSIFGSCCGITYNFTRHPRQLNGVAWGMFFVCTNLYMIQKLLAERREIHFNQSELLLYTQYFKNFDVEPMEFYRLVKLGHWHNALHGDCIVRRGQVLPNVLMISKGNASVLDTYVVFSLSLSCQHQRTTHQHRQQR